PPGARGAAPPPGAALASVVSRRPRPRRSWGHRLAVAALPRRHRAAPTRLGPERGAAADRHGAAGPGTSRAAALVRRQDRSDAHGHPRAGRVPDGVAPGGTGPSPP